MDKYLKILVLSAKRQFSFLSVVISIVKYLFVYVLLFFVISNVSMFSGSTNDRLYFISGIYLLIIFLYKFFYENALFVRYLMITDSFERISTKPINSLFRISIENMDFTILIIAIPIFIGTLSFESFKYPLLILSGLIISISVYITVLSLLLLTSGKISIEKLLLSLFLIGFIGLSSGFEIFLIVIFSILFLFISIKLWNFALIKYTGASS